MEKYSNMQQKQYDGDGQKWNCDNRDPVVGSFDQHNEWKDYEIYLFKDLGDTSNKVALDFGCGPGRNLVKFAHKFSKYDGVDISKVVLEKAKEWLNYNKINHNIKLWHCNGIDLSIIPDISYDIITSTICMQHICVHNIRYNLLKEFYRVLKPNGYITIQMGYGQKPSSVSYYDNNYDAFATNGSCDTRIESASQIEEDLKKIGFIDFKYYIRPVGPGDYHDNWIFFNSRKN